MDDPNPAGAPAAPLSNEEADALFAEHQALRERLAALQARWQAHVETLFPPTRADPLEDAAIAAYYRSVPMAPSRFKTAAAAKSAQERQVQQAWQHLRRKIAAPAQPLDVNPARKDDMSNDNVSPQTPPPDGDEDALRLRSVVRNEATITYAGHLTPEEAARVASEDIAAIGHIADEAMRTQAHKSAGHSRQARTEYKEAFDRLAPVLAAEVERSVPTPPLPPAPAAPALRLLTRPAPLSATPESMAKAAAFRHWPREAALAKYPDLMDGYRQLDDATRFAERNHPGYEATFMSAAMESVVGKIERQEPLSDDRSAPLVALNGDRRDVEPPTPKKYLRLVRRPLPNRPVNASPPAAPKESSMENDSAAPATTNAPQTVPDAATPILEKAAKRNRRNENWGPELPMPPRATLGLGGVPVFTAIGPTLEEVQALRAIVATAARMNERAAGSVPLADTKDLVAGDLAALRAIGDEPTRNDALLAMNDSVLVQDQYRVALSWQAEKVWREIQAAAQRAQHLRDMLPQPPDGHDATRLSAVLQNEEVLVNCRVHLVHDDVINMSTDDIAAIGAIGDSTLRALALRSAGDNRVSHADYKAEFDRQAPALAAELDAVTAPTGERITEQVQLFRSVVGDALYTMSGPDGGVTPVEAKPMVASHLEALDKFDDEHLRNLTIDAIWEAAHAQQHYRSELAAQSPELFAGYSSLVSERARPAHDRATANPTNPGAEAAPTMTIDATALAQLTDARSRDRQAVEKKRGWNTIERGDSAEHKAPAQPAVVLDKAPASPVLPDTALTVVPPEVERAYLHVGNKFYMTNNKKHVAFEDHGAKLQTALHTGKVALSMVQIAQARGWEEIKVSGSAEFRKEAWREAALRGIAVKGYSPSELDQADLARRMAAKPENVVTTTAACPASIDISAEDAAILATAEAMQKAEASATAPAPAADAAPTATAAPAAKLTGDTLVAHGAAKYLHDKTNSDSYYVILENQQGKQRTIWGAGLREAIAKADVKIGDQITLEKNGEKQVEVEANVKNEAGTKVIGTKVIGAVRNEWVVKASAFVTHAPVEAVKAHPDLAGALGKAAAIDKRAAADGYSPAARAIIEQRVKQNLANSIERGDTHSVQLRDGLAIQPQSQPQVQQAQMQ